MVCHHRHIIRTWVIERRGVSNLGYRRAAVYVSAGVRLSAGHRRHMLSRRIGRELPGFCVCE